MLGASIATQTSSSSAAQTSACSPAKAGESVELEVGTKSIALNLESKNVGIELMGDISLSRMSQGFDCLTETVPCSQRAQTKG